MRRALAVLVVLILAAAAGFWAWSRAPVAVPPPPRGVDEPPHPTLRESRWNAPIAARGQRALSGAVLRDGAPVADAVVTALALAGVPALLDAKCACDDCPEKGQEDLVSPLCPDWELDAAARIASRQGEGVPVARTTTAADGTFELQGLDDSVLSVWADAPDGVAHLREVRSDAREVKLELKRGRFLTGTFKRSDGQGLAGVTVTAVLSDERRAFEQVLGPDGALRLGPIPDGKLLVGVLHEDLLPEVLEVGASATRPLDLVLHQPRRVMGVVVDGAPVAGALVRLRGMRATRKVRCGEDGAFTIGRLRPGSYELEAESGDALGRLDVQVGASDDLRDVTIELAQGSRVSGVVVDERGAPVSGAEVGLHTDTSPRRTTSDERGRFVFAAVPAGERMFSVSRDGYLDGSSTSQEAEVTLQLTSAAVLAGRVESAPGVLVLEFRVVADVIEEPDDERDLELVGWGDHVDSTDGTFALSLRPGRYRVHVASPRFPPVELEASAPQRGLVVTVKPGARLTGRVLDADGRPAKDADVLTVGPDARAGEVDSEGRFMLEGLGPGKVTVMAREALDHGPGWVATKEVTLVAGETAEVTLRPELGVALAGVVLDETGKPVAGADVFAASKETARRFGHAVTDAAGRFSLRTLPAGKVNVTALLERERGKEPHRGYVMATAPSEKVVVTLKRDTTLTGRVVDELGAPMKTFKVDLRGFDALDGRFEVPASKGQHAARFEATGFAPRTVTVEVKEGLNDVGDVVLSRGRALGGVVLDEATRAPIGGALVAVKGSAPGNADVVSEASGAVRTDAQGRYRLQHVDPASTQVLATHPDFLFTSVQLPPSASRQDVLMKAGGTVVVRVLDAQGALVSRARVVANGETDFEFFIPEPDGTMVGKGMAPGAWVLSLRNEDKRRTWRPLQIAVREGVQQVELREVVDGVLVRVRAEGATGIALFPGDRQAVGDLEELMNEWRLIEVKGGVAAHVPAGQWTVIAVREGTSSKGLEISTQLLDVPASGEVVVEVVPRWRAVKGGPFFRDSEETPD